MNKRTAAVVVVVLGALLVLAGCGDDDDDAATPTTASAGSNEVATTASADVDVMFDGEECTVTGPESVPAGSVTVVLTDTSEMDVDVDVAGYDDGYTYADLEEYIEENGGEGVRISPPDWSSSVMRDFEASALDLAENQTQYAFVLEAGSHGIVVHRDGDWGCAGFEVT
jgi:hypothetical protein